MVSSSPRPHTLDNNQHTIKLDKYSVLVWRRVLLMRYIKILGDESNTNVKWKDFDIKSRVMTISDEKKTFVWRLPEKDLMKSTTDITIDV